MHQDLKRLLRRAAVWAGFALLFWQGMLWASRGLGQTGGRPGLAALLTHPHNTHGFLQQRCDEWRSFVAQNPKPRAIWFGSSTVMNGVVPGLSDSLSAPPQSPISRSFSWASQGQSLVHIPELLKAALKEASPEVVCIGLSPSAWGYAGNASPETTLNWITQNTLWDRPAWRDASFHLARSARSPHALLLAAQQWLAWRIAPQPLPLPNRRKQSTYGGQGHVARHHHRTRGVLPKKAAAPFPEGWCQIMAEIEQLCNEKGAELVWLVMPVAREVECSLPACIEAQRVIRGDLWPEARRLDLFADDVHMNGEGARAFTRWLAEDEPGEPGRPG